MSRAANIPRIEILDPLRGLAALAVAWFHFTNCSDFVKTGWLRASGAYGWLGVEVFFVISGFIIPYSMYCGGYQLRQHFGRFLAKRLVRLEPSYLVSIVLVVSLRYLSALAGFAGTMPDFSTPQLLLHLGYLNTFFGYPWLNSVYWTLGIEFQYYLFVALVYPMLAAKRTGLRVVVVAGMAAAAILTPSPMLVFHFLALFTLGVLAFQYHAGLLPKRVFVPAVVAGVAIATVGLNLPIGLAGGATALFIAFVPLPRFSAMRVFVFLGSISYSVYLMHTMIGGPVLNLGSRYSGGLFWELLLLAMAMGVSVATAVMFHRLVERPAQRLSSQIKYSRSDSEGRDNGLSLGHGADLSGTGSGIVARSAQALASA